MRLRVWCECWNDEARSCSRTQSCGKSAPLQRVPAQKLCRLRASAITWQLPGNLKELC